MRFRTVLLQSASAAAAAAAGVNGVHAQSTDPALQGYTVSVQGGALFSNGMMVDKCGSSGCFLPPPFSSGYPGVINFDHDLGFNAAISLRKQIDNYWDFGVGASVNHLMDNTASTSYSSTFYESYPTFGSLPGDYQSGSGTVYGTFTQKFGFQSLDAEVGYVPHLTNDFQLRFSGGLRALHYTNTQDKTGGLDKYGSQVSGGVSGSGYANVGFDVSGTYEFLGLGPRVGIGMQKRFEGSQFGISGMLAGAAIFGVERFHASGSSSFYVSGSSGASSYSSSYSGPVYSSGGSSGKTVLDIEAAAGVDYYLDDQSKLTVGYRAEQLTNVGGMGSSGGSGNKLVHGPFLKFEAHF